MNLLDLFHLGVLTRLNSDSFFSDAPTIEILGEDMPGTRQTAATQRTTLGIVGICSKPDFERVEGDLLIFRCSLGFFENQKQNIEGTGGARRAAADCVVIASRLLHRYVVPVTNVNPFGQIHIRTGEYIGEEEGINIWELQFEAAVPIEAI